MQKIKQYYTGLTKAEKVIYIIQIIMAAVALCCWCIWIFKDNSIAALITEFFIGISLFLSGFIKFNEKKGLSVLSIVTGIIISVVFLIMFLNRI